MTQPTAQQTAQSLIGLLDQRLAVDSIASNSDRTRYLEICQFLIEEIEIGMNAVKDEIE